MALIAAFVAFSGQGDSLGAELDAIALKANLPGMGVMVVTSQGESWSHFYGVKKAGEPEAVDSETRWHLGSCTKAMTAAVASRFVEEKKLDLNAPLKQVFPEFKVDLGYEKVTLRHLLAHQGGMVANINWGALNGSLAEVRVEAVKQLLESPPATEVGKFVYSNSGIVVAGYAAEKASGKPIEALLTEEFKEMGILDFGFGPTLKGESWPHLEGKPVSVNSDNPPVLTAAGRANMTLSDWGKWISENLKGLNDKESKLPKLYFEEIRSKPLGGDYAMGWIVTSRPWAGGLALTHSGSNTVNFCSTWVAPGKDFAVLFVTNSAGKDTAKVADDCVTAVIRSKLK